MATTVGTGDLFSGGSATSGVSSTGNSNMDAGSGNFNTNVDLSSLQSISGHTILDGFQASDVASLLAINTNNTVGTITSSAQNIISNITQSSGFKWLMIGIGALIAYFIFKKKRK